jgi:hydroxypyruvate reductase
MTGSADPRSLLRAMFDAAIASADPRRCVPPYLDDIPADGRILVLGAGKASAAMAAAVEATARSQGWADRLEGLVVTRHGHAVPCRHIKIVEASHPVPDAAGQAAARRILDLAQGARAGDLVLCLISGGGSALLALPAHGISMADKQAVNAALLACGAPIDAMNCVRKHMSAIKGGRLAAAVTPARLRTLLISDVPGDDPAVIASGPTVPDPTTYADARAVVARYGVELPASVAARFAAEADETPKPGDPIFAAAETIIVARPQAALEAAADVARSAGVVPVILGDAIEGEARDVAAEQAERAIVVAGADPHRPCVLLSGGETTVTLRGKGGRGGRNAEYLLALALALDGRPGIWALAGDTDGIDGSEDNAGALVAPDTLARARAAGLDPAAALAANDAFNVFAALDDLVMTGPTLTNVNDFRAILSVADGRS